MSQLHPLSFLGHTAHYCISCYKCVYFTGNLENFPPLHASTIADTRSNQNLHPELYPQEPTTPNEQSQG